MNDDRSQSSLSDGWQLVPKVPTREMRLAANQAEIDSRTAGSVEIPSDIHYAAMLAAAPTPASDAFIVRAVNADAELVKTLQDCAFMIGVYNPADWRGSTLQMRVRNALALATETQAQSAAPKPLTGKGE